MPITRRAAIVGAIAGTAAVGAAAFRLANQPPAPALDLQGWLDAASPDELIDYHLTQLAKALHLRHGDGAGYRLAYVPNAKGVLVGHRWSGAAGPVVHVDLEQTS